MYSKKIAFVFLLFILSKTSFAQLSEIKNLSYLLERKDFKTNLIKKGKAPQSYDEFDKERKDIMLINYESDGRKLKGLVETSNIEEGKKKPVLVYLHGGFALGYQDVLDCQPFIDAGFVVFAPSYRGENGNEGNFEMFFGEVDDAKAAVNWIAEQEYTNSDSIFVFGHSIGGGMSLLLSHLGNVPVQMSASSSGLYDFESFESFEKQGIKMPFDSKNEKELLFRLPYGTLHYLPKKHTVYFGEEDNLEYWKATIAQIYEGKEILLEIKGLKGNHFTSLQPSMKLFIEEIRKGEKGNENKTETPKKEDVIVDDNLLEGLQLYTKAHSFYDDENYKEAIPYLEKAAQKGHEGAQFDLAYLYQEGKGIEKNNEKATYWFEKAAKQGSEGAQMALIGIYLEAKNYKELFKVAQVVAQKDNTDVQYLVGMLSAEGKGTPQSYAEAKKWLTLAASKNHVEAVFSLGLLYQNGLGVKQNYAEAAKWYKKNINANHAASMCNLALLYVQGFGVEKNKGEAFKLMNKAYKADASVPDFAYHLGCMYMYGDGVERNPNTAISLMQKAARKGFKPAQEHLKDIDKTW
ncbi:alpha/beta fold hydrolase [Bernardetia sp. OM2101]|uniref:alpha/beta fold hydrolase n=1 Tax=Bernardetia sp. OM2101 TaxID=3344876 RepID=UPI0035D0C352